MEKIQTADEISALVKQMYGSDLKEGGVVHVAAVWQTPEGNYKVIKINDHSPKSDHDTFALNLARARAAVIVTTGKILRDEKKLTHRLFGPAAVGLQEWRSNVLGKSKPPYSLVFTSGRDLDLNHPVFHSGTRPIIYTGANAPADLEKLAGTNGIEVVRNKNSSIRRAVQYLLDRGLETISIEAGPSTSKHLYGKQPMLNELMLSVFTGNISEKAIGDDFATPQELERIFKVHSPEYNVDEASGPWKFMRYTIS